MNYLEISERTRRLIRAAGNPIIKLEELGMLRDFINEKTDLFAMKTRCVYRDDVTFTTTADTALYHLEDLDVFSRVVWLPEAVVLNGAFLTNTYGQFAPTNIRDLREAYTTYLTDASAVPTKWVLLPNGYIRLYPTPDDQYEDTYIQGYCLSTPMDSDSDEPDIPAQYHNCLVVYISAQLLGATTDQDVLETMQFLDQYASREMVELTSHSDKMIGGRRVRGKRGYRGVCL